jgi:RNA polymerase sigma-54 factor
MALTQKLQLRQSQTLVMTPQLMQAIKLLQLSNLDLAAYVEAEIERNPLLDGGTEEDHDRARPIDRTEPGGSERGAEAEPNTHSVAAYSAEAEPGLGHPAEDSQLYSPWAGVGGGHRDGEYNLEAFVPAETTLADWLRQQLALATASTAQRMIGDYLIGLVDETGYIAADLPAVAEKLGASTPEVEAVLAMLQGFDPPGICARDLSECLALQLKDRNRFDPAMAALVTRLDLVAKRDFAALKRVCGVGDEDLADMIAEIRRLNPKPGIAFGPSVVQPIVPDVFVRSRPDGTWLVELNNDTLPKVLINQAYYAEVAAAARRDAEKSYLAERLQSASWLVRALEQRARTILKVSNEIVRQQDGFFAHGVAYLRPLNLKTVADAIGMHESTVSRVTSNKYMATNRGIFELKYFFTSAIPAARGGEAHSAEAVRHRIKQLIDAESAAAVLSDDAIVEELRGAGIEIARRTVAKYREALRIPSSVQRRREKLAAPLG